MTKTEAAEVLNRARPILATEELKTAIDMAIEALKDKEDEPQFYTEDDYWNGMFAESAEAYKAWTGEEMGGDGDEINETNREIIKDILKTMPTAYLLEALGVSAFEELTEPADRPHGEWIPCSEKLPSESDDYFCTIPLDAEENYTEVLMFHKGRFYEDDAEWGATYHDDVLAWMPLPTPYKGGDTK